MDNEKTLAGKRLSEEIIRKFGSQKAAAQAIGAKDGSYFTPYLTGKSAIGGILQKKLLDAGLDLVYVLEGTRAVMTDQLVRDLEISRRKISDMQYRIEQIKEDLQVLSDSMDRIGQYRR